MIAEWITPNWPAPSRVRAVCTTRAGGGSKHPFDSLNLGDHVGDDAVSVAQNRATLQRHIDAHPVFLKQVHGAHVAGLPLAPGQSTEADGCFTQSSGIACTIMVADCLPVLLTNTQGSFVAAAHAGWRGLAGVGGVGIVETVCQAIESCTPAPERSEILAWLGPCIGASKFEVGDEVREAFVSHDTAAIPLFEPLGHAKWLADLQGLSRLRLRNLGVTQIFGNDGTSAWCTGSQPSRFFSHRRDHLALGGSGRMGACIWLD